MRDIIKIENGVVAEYKGKYWGVQRVDSYSTDIGFGVLSKAYIGNPEFCKTPTDMTYSPENTGGYNPHFDKLKKAKLVGVRKTTTVKIEFT